VVAGVGATRIGWGPTAKEPAAASALGDAGRR